LRWIVWGATGASVLLVWGGLPLLLPPITEDPVLAAVLVAAGIAYCVPAAWLARQTGLARGILGLALLEASAALGLVAWLLGADLYWAPGLAAFLGWAAAWPRLGPAAPGVDDLSLPPPIGQGG
jgi:hypothetical protein